MLELWVIYADDAKAPNFGSVRIDGQMLQGQSPDAVFEEAAATSTLRDRGSKGMWTTDPDAEHGRVAIKAFGCVPIPRTPRTTWYG